MNEFRLTAMCPLSPPFHRSPSFPHPIRIKTSAGPVIDLYPHASRASVSECVSVFVFVSVSVPSTTAESILPPLPSPPLLQTQGSAEQGRAGHNTTRHFKVSASCVRHVSSANRDLSQDFRSRASGVPSRLQPRYVLYVLSSSSVLLQCIAVEVTVAPNLFTMSIRSNDPLTNEQVGIKPIRARRQQSDGVLACPWGNDSDLAPCTLPFL